MAYFFVTLFQDVPYRCTAMVLTTFMVCIVLSLRIEMTLNRVALWTYEKVYSVAQAGRRDGSYCRAEKAIARNSKAKLQHLWTGDIAIGRS